MAPTTTRRQQEQDRHVTQLERMHLVIDIVCAWQMSEHHNFRGAARDMCGRWAMVSRAWRDAVKKNVNYIKAYHFKSERARMLTEGMLSTNDVVHTVSLRHCHVGIHGARAFADLFRANTNTSLTSLDLW